MRFGIPEACLRHARGMASIVPSESGNQTVRSEPSNRHTCLFCDMLLQCNMHILTVMQTRLKLVLLVSTGPTAAADAVPLWISTGQMKATSQTNHQTNDLSPTRPADNCCDQAGEANGPGPNNTCIYVNIYIYCICS